MIIAITKITLYLPENHSLKGKRNTIKSLVKRVRNQFNVSISEVSISQNLTSAVLGISLSSNNSQHADEVLEKVVSFIEQDPGHFYLGEEQREITGGF